MEDEYLDIDKLHKKQRSNVTNELNMYVTTGAPALPSRPSRAPNTNNDLNMYVTTGRPDTRARPSKASVQKRTVERPQEGAYDLAGGGRVIYDLSERNAKIETIKEEKTEESCFRAHQKKVGIITLIIVVVGVATGVGVKFGILETSNETAIDCLWGEWTVETCSKECGGGVRLKIRTKLISETNGGNCSGYDRTTESCNTQKCITVPDYCLNYKNITESWRRIGYIRSFQRNCDEDNLSMDGVNWHRFVEPAGTQLPTEPLQDSLNSTSVCGTHGTAWMDGGYPTLADGIVTRKICFAYRGKQCFGSTLTYYAGVAACYDEHHNFFYVYQLKRPDGCSHAYCAT